MIFRSGPYFLGAQGLYLGHWNPLNFNLERDIPVALGVWVKLPYFPPHYWNDVTFRLIGNSLRKYVDYAEPRDGLFRCAGGLR